MAIYYLFDHQQISSGKVERSAFEAVPPESTDVAPPDLVEPQVAHWDGSAWSVLGERPAYPSFEQVSSDVRVLRNRLLADTDWMALKDSPVMSAEWAAYRQSLRDVTAQTGFPYAVLWPTKPE